MPSSRPTRERLRRGSRARFPPDAGKSFRESICHKAYPVEERAGVIFAYMGPGKPPLIPNYGYLTVPLDHVYVTKIYQECNYLQGNEGNIDIMHLSYLHFNKYRDTGGPSVEPVKFSGQGGAPGGLETTEADLTDFGLRVCKTRKVGADKKYLRVGNFVMPNLRLDIVPEPSAFVLLAAAAGATLVSRRRARGRP